MSVNTTQRWWSLPASDTAFEPCSLCKWCSWGAESSGYHWSHLPLPSWLRSVTRELEAGGGRLQEEPGYTGWPSRRFAYSCWSTKSMDYGGSSGGRAVGSVVLNPKSFLGKHCTVDGTPVYLRTYAHTHTHIYVTTGGRKSIENLREQEPLAQTVHCFCFESMWLQSVSSLSRKTSANSLLVIPLKTHI